VTAERSRDRPQRLATPPQLPPVPARLQTARIHEELGEDRPAPPYEKNYVDYARDHLQREVLAPAGITNVTCDPSSPDTDGMAYGANATQASRGWILRWLTNECHGATGLRLNSIEMVRYLSHLRFGSILPQDAVSEMDSVLGGWNGDSSYGTFVKGGDLTIGAVDVGDEDPTRAGRVHVHTCVVTFPDGTAASVIVNSPLRSPDRAARDALADVLERLASRRVARGVDDAQPQAVLSAARQWRAEGVNGPSTCLAVTVRSAP